MNTQEYQQLLSKFYQAETSAEEEKLLKNFDNNTPEDRLIFESLQEEKTQKMNWDFEDFLVKTQEETAVVPISKVEIQTSRTKTSWYWMVASFLAILGLGYFLLNNDSTQKPIPKEIVKNEKLPSMRNPTQTIEKPEVIHENVAQNTPTKIKAQYKHRISAKQTKMLAKNTKAKQQKTENEIVDQPMNIQDTEYESSFVMINGKKIENEEAAIHITQNAFKMFAGNVSAGVQQTEILKRIELEF